MAVSLRSLFYDAERENFTKKLRKLRKPLILYIENEFQILKLHLLISYYSVIVDSLEKAIYGTKNKNRSPIKMSGQLLD